MTAPSSLLYRQNRHRSPGFSLVELLVVIGVVAILAGLVVPALSGVRSASLETRSLQQLRQLGSAMRVYASDHQQKFPPGYFYNPAARPSERTWASELLGYLGLPERYYDVQGSPFISPSSSVPVRSGVNAGFTPFTYSVNFGLCPDTSAYDIRPRISQVLRPAEVILLADGCQLANTYSAATLSKPPEFGSATGLSKTVNLDTPIPVGPDLDDPNSRGWLRYRNRGKVATVMVDGHAELFKKGTVRYRHLIFNR